LPGVFIVVPPNDDTGSIYLANYDHVGPSQFGSVQMIRLTGGGSVDPAFNAGTGALSAANQSSTIKTVVLVNDGSGDLFVGGAFATFGGFNPNTDAVRDLARVNPDGTLDRTSPKPDVSEPVTLLANATDGTGALFVVQGQRLSRYNANGVLDSNFVPGLTQGGAGIQTLLAHVGRYQWRVCGRRLLVLQRCSHGRHPADQQGRDS
jgi:hypothetical protein